MKRARFERSAMTELLIDVLRGVNDSISYTELSRRADAGLMRVRASLSSARAALQRDKIVFESVTGWGLRRLSDVETVHSSVQYMRRAHNASRRGSRRVQAVSDFAALPPREQILASTNQAIFAAIQEQTQEARKPSSKPIVARSPVPDVSKFS